MSLKETTIQHLRKARAQHVKWVEQIKLLVSGIPMEKEKIALSKTEGAFGEWFYGEASSFSTSQCKTVIEEMAEAHTACHDHYLKIYRLVFGGNSQSGGLFQGLFGSRNKASSSDLILAQHCYADVVVSSDRLLNRLRIFESQLLATPEEKFKEILMFLETPVPAVEPAVLHAATPKRIYRGQLID